MVLYSIGNNFYNKNRKLDFLTKFFWQILLMISKQINCYLKFYELTIAKNVFVIVDKTELIGSNKFFFKKIKAKQKRRP